MNSPTQLAPCHFLPRRHAKRGTPPTGSRWIDVSSHADEPYDRLSPFYAHGGIPIPGMPGKTSDCVEGIWQGLKVMRGKTAPRYFEGWGKKRRGKPAGHQFGTEKRLLGIVEARRRLYVPAYEWMLEHRAGDVVEELVERALGGTPQWFYDYENNGSIGNANAPLAHASVLARYVNRLCEARLD